jgi:regulator of cell morphogenesis and NO signaling
MNGKSTFGELVKRHGPTLKQYVPIVDKVHGGNHPEFHEVRAVYERLSDKIQDAGWDKAELREEFASLREITANYAVPGDVCESYAAVYTMLGALDAAYHS